MQFPCLKEKSPIDCCWFSVPYGMLLKTGSCLVTSNADLQVSHAGGGTHSAQFSKGPHLDSQDRVLVLCSSVSHTAIFLGSSGSGSVHTHPPPSPVSDPEPLTPRCTSSHHIRQVAPFLTPHANTVIPPSPWAVKLITSPSKDGCPQ